MPTTIDRTRVMTIKEAADHLEITPQHVRSLIRSGKLAAFATLFGRGVTQASVTDYERDRGPWRKGGVVGGNAARHRLGLD